MKADLHVHSYHSGYTRRLRWVRARECYSSPEAIYRLAKARGMDLVCLTDHDSIDGCREFLDRHPDVRDFITGEEIECRVPDAPGLRIHLGALGIDDAVHAEVQRLRANVFDTAAYLRQQGIFFAFNHLFMLFQDEMDVDAYVRQALRLAPALEIRNGAMTAAHNDLIADLAAALREAGEPVTGIGGSDAHTLHSVGRTYTEAPGATPEEFLSSLVAGRASVGGEHGGVGRLMGEIYGVIVNHWRSLIGLERHDLHGIQRLVSTLGSALLLPAQFVPAIIAFRMKRDEGRRVSRYRHRLRSTSSTAPVATPTWSVEG